MAVSYMDFTADDLQFKANMKDHLLFKKNDANYVNELGIEQLNTIGNMTLLDIYLSNGNVFEAHYHQNASELVYCVTGSATVSMINPDTEELIQVDIDPQKVASIPQGWWHYISAKANETHLLSTFDTPMLQTTFGSQILRIMPKDALAHMYCLDEETVEAALDPIDETVTIGPPSDCDKGNEEGNNQNNKKQNMNNTPPEAKAKRTWQPFIPPFPGAYYPER